MHYQLLDSMDLERERGITIILNAVELNYTAKKGESFYFTPHSEHYIEAFGTSGAVILWVSTPPNF